MKGSPTHNDYQETVRDPISSFLGAGCPHPIGWVSLPDASFGIKLYHKD